MEKRFNFRLGHGFLLSWTVKTLKEYGLKPRKALSQNFIVDPRLLEEFASHVSSAHSLEIGCGIGTLSMVVLHQVKSLACIEIDARLCDVARAVVESPKFLVIHGDATKIPFNAEQVVSNLPYHITSHVLVKIARENNVQRAVLTVQKEVADRLLAKPGSKNYGKLSVLINLVFTVRKGGSYPPSSFYPRPKVYHQVIVLERKIPYSDNISVLERVVKKLFTQRRRVIDKLVEEYFSIRLSDLGEVGVRLSGKRVMMLSPVEFYELSLLLKDAGVVD